MSLTHPSLRVSPQVVVQRQLPGAYPRRGFVRGRAIILHASSRMTTSTTARVTVQHEGRVRDRPFLARQIAVRGDVVLTCTFAPPAGIEPATLRLEDANGSCCPVRLDAVGCGPVQVRLRKPHSDVSSRDSAYGVVRRRSLAVPLAARARSTRGAPHRATERYCVLSCSQQGARSARTGRP